MKEEHFAKRGWEIRHRGAALKEEHFAKRGWEIRHRGAALKEEHFAKRGWEIRLRKTKKSNQAVATTSTYCSSCPIDLHKV